MPKNSDANLITDLPPTDGEFEELAIAEEEFLDAYIRNELAADERILFEKALRGSARLRNRLHFARLLAKEISFVPQPAATDTGLSPNRSQVESRGLRKWAGFLTPSFVLQPAFRLALAASVLMVLLGGAALFAGWMKLRNESQQLATERTALEQERQSLEKRAAEQQSRSEQLSAELTQERQKLDEDRKRFEELRGAQISGDKTQSPASLATLFLSPDLTRGGSGSAELSLAPGTSKIRLDLGLESVDYAKYRAIIKTARGVAVIQQDLRPARSRKSLTLQFPTERFSAGDYSVQLSGLTSSGAFEPVNEYTFRITSKQK